MPIAELLYATDSGKGPKDALASAQGAAPDVKAPDVSAPAEDAKKVCLISHHM